LKNIERYIKTNKRS